MDKNSEDFKIGRKLGKLILGVEDNLVTSKVTLLALAIIREYHPEIDLKNRDVKNDVIAGLAYGYLATPLND